MNKLNNFKQNPVKKLQYVTKVRIVNRKPKLNEWIGLAKNDSYMITDYQKYNHDNNYNYKEIEIDNTSLTHKNINSLNLVINVNSSVSLFTFFLFNNTNNVDNIVYYLNVNENMLTLANYLYENIYNNNLALAGDGRWLPARFRCCATPPRGNLLRPNCHPGPRRARFRAAAHL